LCSHSQPLPLFMYSWVGQLPVLCIPVVVRQWVEESVNKSSLLIKRMHMCLYILVKLVLLIQLWIGYPTNFSFPNHFFGNLIEFPMSFIFFWRKKRGIDGVKSCFVHWLVKQEHTTNKKKIKVHMEKKKKKNYSKFNVSHILGLKFFKLSS
jgi:hypothetical protein